jgi:hypothetical protein
MKNEKKLSKVLSRQRYMGYFSTIGFSNRLLSIVLWTKTNEMQIESYRIHLDHN